MDNFLDKVAQKFNAQDVIKANSQAEAAELKRLQIQVAEYEKILQDMRKLNYKNVELIDKMNAILDANAEKMQELQNAEQINLNKLQDIVEEQGRSFEEAQKMLAQEAQRKEEFTKKEEELLKKEADISQLDHEALEGFFRRSDEYMHKENIKVYRNVQAVIIEELKQQTAALCEENNRITGKFKGVTIIQGITMLLLAVCIALQIINM